MQAGKLRHRVIIKNFTTAADTMGQPINTFATLATVWARVTPKSGSEFVNEGASKIQKVYEVTIRYTGDINETYKIEYDSKDLNIQSIIDIDERNRTMKLLCIEDI
jgi:SPP1 family predicted phage head-tail adaptor